MKQQIKDICKIFVKTDNPTKNKYIEKIKGNLLVYDGVNFHIFHFVLYFLLDQQLIMAKTILYSSEFLQKNYS